MKKIGLTILAVVFGFCFVTVVNAQEKDLSDIAIISGVIGGSDKEITQNSDNTNTYKYYYKIIEIDDSDFATYVSSKYAVDNGNDASDDYVAAQSRVTEYEESFNGLVPTLNSTADLSTWTTATNNEIAVQNIKYELGKHHGYVLAVAATKDGDQNIYVSRMILESTSATTLGSIAYNDSDAAAYNASTNDAVPTTDTATGTNPDTGIEDWAIYFVPISIILGSGILLRRNYA